MAPVATSGQIIGGVTTADLTGGGYNDVLVPDHRRPGHLRRPERPGGRHLARSVGTRPWPCRTRPLVTTDPNGTIGITIAGYNGQQRRGHPALRGGRLGRTLAGQAVVAHVPPEPSADRHADRAGSRASQQAGGGHRLDARRRRLLRGGLGRRDLRLRLPPLLRVARGARRSTSPSWASPRVPETPAATGWWRPTAASSPTGRTVLRFDGRHAPGRPHRGDGGHAQRRRVLAGGQ